MRILKITLITLFLSTNLLAQNDTVEIKKLTDSYSIKIGTFVIPDDIIIVRNPNGTISIPEPRLAVSTQNPKINNAIAFKLKAILATKKDFLFHGHDYFCSLLGMKVLDFDTLYFRFVDAKNYIEFDEDKSYLRFGKLDQMDVIRNLTCGK